MKSAIFVTSCFFIFSSCKSLDSKNNRTKADSSGGSDAISEDFVPQNDPVPEDTNPPVTAIYIWGEATTSFTLTYSNGTVAPPGQFTDTYTYVNKPSVALTVKHVVPADTTLNTTAVYAAQGDLQKDVETLLKSLEATVWPTGDKLPESCSVGGSTTHIVTSEGGQDFNFAESNFPCKSNTQTDTVTGVTYTGVFDSNLSLADKLKAIAAKYTATP